MPSPSRLLLPALLLATVAGGETPGVGPGAVTASPARAEWLVRSLVGFGTRHTLSTTTESCRGIGAARRFLADELRAISRETGGRLRVVEDEWLETSGGERLPGPPPRLVNVLGILPGVDPALSKRVLVVSGHYDSRVTDILDAVSDAPGAGDDASGTAVVMEAARLVSREATAPRRTIVFAALPGEEQGLLGGRRLVAWCKEQGYEVEAVLNHDIVGSPVGPDGVRRDGDVRVLSSDRGGLDGPARTLARQVVDVARRTQTVLQPRLIYRRDRRMRGGDHVPFDEAGFAAVRLTEPAENYDREHQDLRTENGRVFGDLPDLVDFRYVANVATLSSRVVLELAIAPPTPVDSRLVGVVVNDTTLTWKAAPATPPGTTYEVLVRETSAPTWQEVRPAGPALRVVYPNESADDRVYAVRAIGPEGARGLPAPVGEAASAPGVSYSKPDAPVLGSPGR